jgi:phytoene desaturase
LADWCADIGTIGIIGGGVSGLAAGVWLARAGLRVVLFETNAKLGGCCATTRVAGYAFNDGALYVALPSLLGHAFARLGLDLASTVALRPIVAPQATRLADGTVVAFGQGREVRVYGVNGEARTAQAAEGIERLMQRWQPVLRLFADDLLLRPPSPARLLRKGWRHLHKLRGTLAEELTRHFPDPAVRAAMAGTLLYTGTPARAAPVTQVLGLVGMLDEGLWLPEGGMGTIPDALLAALQGLGAEVYTTARVERIERRNGRVCGLRIAGHGVCEVDAVISTVSGMVTFGSLLDGQGVPGAMRHKASDAPLSHRALAVQLGLANAIEVDSHCVGILPMMEEQHKLFLPSDGVPRWFNYTVPTVTMPELAPAGGSIVEMFPPIDQAWPVDRWNDETKEAVGQQAIEALARSYPLDIAVRRVMGPRDFRDRLHLYNGSVYGLSPAAPPSAQFPHRTPVDGLFQAGQTTYPGFGVSTSIVSGVLAAEALVATL